MPRGWFTKTLTFPSPAVSLLTMGGRGARSSAAPPVQRSPAQHHIPFCEDVRRNESSVQEKDTPQVPTSGPSTGCLVPRCQNEHLVTKTPQTLQQIPNSLLSLCRISQSWLCTNASASFEEKSILGKHCVGKEGSSEPWTQTSHCLCQIGSKNDDALINMLF